MDLRLRSLDSIDPLAVPLPHGTEVITRVDRVLPDRLIPQGTIGRVSSLDGDRVEVTVPGLGVVRYARAELTPRKAGQAAFAQRRAER